MIGLAYNAFGGSIMYIESSVTNLTKETKTEEVKKESKKNS